MKKRFALIKIITPRNESAKFAFKFKYAACGVASVSEPNYMIISDFWLGRKPAYSLANIQNVLPTNSLTIFRLLANEKC